MRLKATATAPSVSTCTARSPRPRRSAESARARSIDQVLKLAGHAPKLVIATDIERLLRQITLHHAPRHAGHALKRSQEDAASQPASQRAQDDKHRQHHEQRVVLIVEQPLDPRQRHA